MHDLEYDIKYSVFKVVVYVKSEFNSFSGLQISYWSVVSWSLVGWSVIGGRLVGGFKETLTFPRR